MRRWASWQGSADHGPIRDTARTAPSSSPPPNGGKPAAVDRTPRPSAVNRHDLLGGVIREYRHAA